MKLREDLKPDEKPTTPWSYQELVVLYNQALKDNLRLTIENSLLKRERKENDC